MFPSLKLLSCSLLLFATFPLQTLHKILAHEHPQNLLLTFPSTAFLGPAFLGHACSPSLRLLSGQLLHLGFSSTFTRPHILLLQFPSKGYFQVTVNQFTKVLQRENLAPTLWLSLSLSLTHGTPWMSYPIGCLIH